MAEIELSKSQIDNLIDFFDFEFIDSIRRNEETDNMKYLVDMCDVYTKLEKANRLLKGGSE